MAVVHTPNDSLNRIVSSPGKAYTHDVLGNRLTPEDGANGAVSPKRPYDAWGAVRAGVKDTTKLTYCANLGHKEDDESGLIYMRARYYEPGSGRFISEDPAMDGGNWFTYCDSNPTNFVDSTGKAAVLNRLVGVAITFFIGYLLGLGREEYQEIAIGFMFSVACKFIPALSNEKVGAFAIQKTRAVASFVAKQFISYIKSVEKLMNTAARAVEGFLLLSIGYAAVLFAELFAQEMESYS